MPIDDRGLHGFTVGVTADRRSDEQISLFERRGATVLHGPTIRTMPLGSDDGLLAATEAVIARPPDVLVANTGLGIRSWFGSAEAWDLGDDLHTALARSRIYARGPKAAGAVHALGFDVVGRPASERLRDCVALVMADLGEAIAGTRVVVQRDGGSPPPAAAELRAAGAEVLEVPVYSWAPAADPRPALRLAEAVLSGRVHAVTFTAGPAIASWMTLADAAGLGDQLRHALSDGDVVVGCVGPVCAETARSAGLVGEIVEPRTTRLGPLVRVVAERLLERRRRIGDVELTGTAVRFADRTVELSPTEARLLDSLARQRGAVVPKPDLLRSVWGDPNADPHLVEVTVARLRRRLGQHGPAIEAVPRRGYIIR